MELKSAAGVGDWVGLVVTGDAVGILVAPVMVGFIVGEEVGAEDGMEVTGEAVGPSVGLGVGFGLFLHFLKSPLPLYCTSQLAPSPAARKHRSSEK